MKSYRSKFGYTQEKMADLLGISRATYCDYEVNPQSVRIEVFKKMSDILNCNLSDFFMTNDVTNSDIYQSSNDS